MFESYPQPKSTAGIIDYEARIPRWLRACIAKAVRDAVEETRSGRESAGPPVAVESLVIAATARETLKWLLREESFALVAGTPSGWGVVDKPGAPLRANDGWFFCWLETCQRVFREAGFVDLATDTLAIALNGSGWADGKVLSTRVRWAGPKSLGRRLKSDPDLSYLAQQIERHRSPGLHVRALSPEVIRCLRNAGIAERPFPMKTADHTVPKDVSAAYVLQSCLEYPEIWSSREPTAAIMGAEGTAATGDSYEAIVLDLRSRVAS